MPSSTRVGCKHFGCPALIEPGAGYCTEHKRAKWRAETINRMQDPYEAWARKFYNSKAWRMARLMQLRAHPLCALCGKAAEMVDHIKRVRDGGERLSANNFQSLCHSCHNRKRQQEGSQAR
jgi:5-methylcytosine-specific restriction protein A